MRRAFAYFICIVVLGLSASAAVAQYPYPYPQPYPMPMPAYVPNPMMGRPMYAPPPMMYPAPAQAVYVYGPLTNDARSAQPNAFPPPPRWNGAPPQVPEAIRLAQANVQTQHVVAKNELPPDACASNCGPACNDFPGSCGPNCEQPPWDRPIRGHGHFIGDVAAYFLAYFPTSRIAYNTTTAGNTTPTDFDNSLTMGERISVGYVFHTGWGARGNFTYVNGVVGTTVNNPVGSGTAITTPFAPPFGIASPSPALAAGIGVDAFDFKQRLQMQIADVELLRESHFLDTTFLFSAGARYARVMQSYTATRTNPGGVAPGVAVLLDRQDLDSSSFFQGWGPTVSLEVVHPLAAGFSLYANGRGSFLFGTDRFVLNAGRQTRTVDGGGVITLTDTANTTTAFDTRFDASIEAEGGVQFGCRVRRTYVYSRVGVVFQRWWEVGTPTSANGDISFVGGVARVGISY